jgi:hypothetical protein
MKRLVKLIKILQRAGRRQATMFYENYNFIQEQKEKLNQKTDQQLIEVIDTLEENYCLVG